MTKKRFTDIWCSETGDIGFTYDGVDLTFKGDSLETFLNEIVEKNEQLQHDATVLIQANIDYKKENEQLKKDIKYLDEKIKENEWHWNTIDEDRDVWHYKCTEAEKRVEELKGENEQLKQCFRELITSGYWDDDYLTEQDWDDLKQWIERVFEKVMWND